MKATKKANLVLWAYVPVGTTVSALVEPWWIGTIMLIAMQAASVMGYTLGLRASQEIRDEIRREFRGSP